jgi:hypothetical protein
LNVRVRAANGAWSALAQPRYLLASRQVPGPRDLLVTEIQYHPGGLDDCEFVELYNASTNLLDLSGVSLSNAVRFVFPAGYALAPGGFTVVTKNSGAFSTLYQSAASPWFWPGLMVAGQWIGSLDNAGETISLVGSNGLVLSSVSYQPNGRWPGRADGQGSSLELAVLPDAALTDSQVQAFLADAAHWRASSLYQGSPGRFDTFSPAVRINEVFPHTESGLDWIELVNGSGQTVDLSSCSLTDNMSQPARWVFPTNAVLAAGQFLVLTQAQLGFGLSAAGESLFLLRMSGTNVLRFLDSADLPAVDRDEAVGLFLRSDGGWDLSELRGATAGGANALPRVGPVVISEIMAAPAVGKAAYLALTSITNAPVPFFEGQQPTNVWVLAGVGNYAFPAGMVLAPCGTVILSATNPDAFRVQYAVSPAVQVLGPWTGNLAVEGETLKLLRPGPPGTGGAIPYYRVDHASYRSASPWPVPGPGGALVRSPLQAYGNDPASWRSGATNGPVAVPATNHPPAVSISGNLTVPQASPMVLSVSASDPDAPWQSVVLQPTQLPSGSSFDAGASTLTWTPSLNQGPGEYPVEFVASDSAVCDPGQVTLRFAIQVVEALRLSARFAAGVLELSFVAGAGQVYRVDFCDDLAAADWRLVQEFTAVEGGPATVVDSRAVESAGRFYRLRWMR